MNQFYIHYKGHFQLHLQEALMDGKQVLRKLVIFVLIICTGRLLLLAQVWISR